MAENKDEVAVRVANVSKSFKLPHEKHTSVKGALIGLFNSNRSYEKQQVLNDVSFDIKRGDFFGIVGRNGSGKSTLLKLIAGIYSPEAGTIQVNGSLTPFIELGVGFNPELTGRENVFLNGALLGFNRKQMIDMYDEIVEFAELKKFMDQKLKNYSSGMQVRLAFSIAIRAKSEILVLDEVLAVGDAAFQKKCFRVFEDYKRRGQTIVIVTHDMGVVEKYCNKAVYLKDGDLLLSGRPSKISKEYREQNDNAYADSLTKEQDKKLLNKKKLQKIGAKWSLVNRDNRLQTKFYPGDSLKVKLSWESDRVHNIGVALLRQNGEYVFGTNTFIDRHKIKDKTVTYSLDLDVGEGDYIIYFGFFGKNEAEVVDFIDEGPRFIVVAKSKQGWQGITELKHGWDR